MLLRRYFPNAETSRPALVAGGGASYVPTKVADSKFLSQLLLQSMNKLEGRIEGLFSLFTPSGDHAPLDEVDFLALQP